MLQQYLNIDLLMIMLNFLSCLEASTFLILLMAKSGGKICDRDKLLFVCLFGVSLTFITLQYAFTEHATKQRTLKQEDKTISDSAKICGNKYLTQKANGSTLLLDSIGNRMAVLNTSRPRHNITKGLLRALVTKCNFFTDNEVTAWIDASRFHKNSKYYMFVTFSGLHVQKNNKI